MNDLISETTLAMSLNCLEDPFGKIQCEWC